MNKLIRNSLQIIFTFLLVFTFSTLISPSYAQAETGCAQYTGDTRKTCEKNVLMDIFNRTGGPNWTNKTGWGSQTDYCTWYGLSCTNSGFVETLSLASNNLQSSALPTSVGDLSSLRRIRIERNSLSGSVPESITRLNNLVDFIFNYQSLGVNAICVNSQTVRDFLITVEAKDPINNNVQPGPRIDEELPDCVASNPTPTPTPGSVTWPSYCGCQATAKALVPLADCGDNTMQCAPPVPDSRNNLKYVRRLENNQCYDSYYWCDSNGTPPAGNCGCDAVTTLDVTNNYPSEALCLGRNQMMAQCILPSSSYQQYSGFKRQWQNGRCVLLQYTCPAFSQPPMSLQVYAGEYMKMMRGRAFDPRIDVNGDNVRDLRDFYRLWQMWREQGTAHAPSRAGKEAGAGISPIDM